ncbi:AraC family transcriptional regulator [Clostridium sp.]|uniref:AraC family transcriptional regulator n=1 Tax=Clostridium sp. TaxID=1506 RepID=UPI0028489D17|nr:AraC family transcriptional regulator [Clostridium sp.]MDR3595403.1 AraC family transcriptional regulator [Clostridium sp.]
MNYSYEIVTTPKNIPAKIIINSSPNLVYKHWHKDLELIYSYKGSFISYINGENFSVPTKALTLINSGAIHSIDKYNADSNTTITLLISYQFLKLNYPDIENIEFKLNQDNKTAIKKLKDIYEKIGSVYLQDMTNNNQSLLIVDDQEFIDKFHYLKITSLLYEILYILLSEFSINKDLHLEIKTQKHLDRLKIITEFIDNNYKDNITLEEIATRYDISKEYLATIFKKYIGITVGTYLKNIRLKAAYRDLVNTDYSINQLAFDNGFPNIKSFINSFKEHYGKTPYKYKKDLENSQPS